MSAGAGTGTGGLEQLSRRGPPVLFAGADRPEGVEGDPDNGDATLEFGSRVPVIRIGPAQRFLMELSVTATPFVCKMEETVSERDSP
jgi:hypothetical protein